MFEQFAYHLVEQIEFQKKLGQQIARLRKDKKISQVDFAYILDKEKQNLNKIEKGKSNPTAWTLKCIADALEVPVKKLFDWE